MKNTWKYIGQGEVVNTEEVDGYGTQRAYLTNRKDGIVFHHKGVINNESTVGISLDALKILMNDAGFDVVDRVEEYNKKVGQ